MSSLEYAGSRSETDLNLEDIGPILPLTPLFEAQAMGPAPSQTFYAITVYPVDPRLSHLDLSGAGHVDPHSTKKTITMQPAQEVVLNRIKMRKGCVVLRDWPRKRHSQTWTRSGQANPSQTVFDYIEILSGEMEAQLTSIFGPSTYVKILSAVKSELNMSD